MSDELTWDNITQPEPGGYQVRVVRRSKETSRYFSFKSWGGKDKAFAAANNWRDMVKIALRKSTRRLLNPSKRNKSTGCRGISRSIHYDKRNDKSYLGYGVCWTDHTGKRRNKIFQAGNIKNYNEKLDQNAFATAKRFRADWEAHADADTLREFDPAAYKNWRDQYLEPGKQKPTIKKPEDKPGQKQYQLSELTKFKPNQRQRNEIRLKHALKQISG